MEMKLIDHCADWYKEQGITFSVENPDQGMYEKWIEYAFQGFKEVN
jgi:hypothetical protein